MRRLPDRAKRGHARQFTRLIAQDFLGDEVMRSNSGKGDSTNNMRDPTIRDRTEERTSRPHRTNNSQAKAPADHRAHGKD